MSEPFQPSRSDGRSDRLVVYNLVADAEPETLLTYDELIRGLSEGLNFEVDRPRVYRAVAAANKTLLVEKSRYLGVVKNIGYRVLRTEEHLPAAIDRKSSAVSKLRQGMELLRNAKVEELTEAQRVLHQGQLLIMSGLHDAIQDSRHRHDRQESIIQELRDRQKANYEELRKRLDRLESDDE